MGATSADFSLRALYDALDAERQARGLSWAQLTGAINGAFARGGAAARLLSPTTVTGLRVRSVAEGDGVLQMLRWLNRAPETFVPGHEHAPDAAAPWPSVDAHRILRFDTRQLHAALDVERRERHLSWTDVAAEIGGVSAAGLTRLSKGGRTSFPHVMRMAQWLGQPVTRFTKVSDR